MDVTDKIFPDRSVPLCTRCLAPQHPLTHYCPVCGEAVGQFTPYIPYVNIRFQANFFGDAWRLTWAPDTGILLRVLCIVSIALLAPILFVATPLAISRGRRKPRGFDVEQTPQQTAQLPREQDPPGPPSYSDRPIIPH